MENPFPKIVNATPDQAFQILDELNPQGIAIILYFLTTLHGKLILEKFTPIKRKEILEKIDILSPLDDEAMGALAKIIQEKMNSPATRVNINGQEILKNILKNSSSEIQNQFSNFLPQNHSQNKTIVTPAQISYNELSKINNKSFQKLIRETDRKLLLLSLKTEADAFKRKLKENSSQGALELLESDLRDYGPAKKSEIIKAQNKITQLAQEFSEQGIITLDFEEDLI